MAVDSSLVSTSKLIPEKPICVITLLLGDNPFSSGRKEPIHMQFLHFLRETYFLCRYLEPLAIALDKEKWSLVQFLLSSSYTGYGITSLKEVTACFPFLFLNLLNHVSLWVPLLLVRLVVSLFVHLVVSFFISCFMTSFWLLYFYPSKLLRLCGIADFLSHVLEISLSFVLQKYHCGEFLTKA